MILSLVRGSMASFHEFGWKFLISSQWDPTQGKEQYGALLFIAGTLFTSVLA